jgi:hypothetical protein
VEAPEKRDHQHTNKTGRAQVHGIQRTREIHETERTSSPSKNGNTARNKQRGTEERDRKKEHKKRSEGNRQVEIIKRGGHRHSMKKQDISERHREKDI